MLEILHKHMNESQALITVMSEFFFGEGFSLGHVVITTIINRNARYQEGYLTKSKTLKSCVNKISKLLEAYMYNVRICKSIYYIHILIINL